MSDSYALFRCDRVDRSGGGVALFCDKKTNPVRLRLPNHLTVVEAICLELHTRYKVRVLCIYRPPNCSQSLHEAICELITFCADSPNPLVVIGDFNLPSFDWLNFNFPEDQVHTSFANCIIQNGLEQSVQEATRGENLLDLVFTNEPLLVSMVETSSNFAYFDHVSDHKSITFQININSNDEHVHNVRTYNFRKANIDRIKMSLMSINWAEAFENCYTIDEIFSKFLEYFKGILDANVPKFAPKRRRLKYPKKILKLQALSAKLARTKHVPGGYKKWKDALAACSVAIRNYVSEREKSILESNDISAFYKYINERRIVQEGVAPLKTTNGEIAFLDSEKAEILNAQFISVFTNDNGAKPPFAQRTEANFSSFVINSERVRKFLCKLPNKYSHSPNEIPSAILRALSYELCDPLCRIFKFSLNSGLCPALWKNADIIAIYKKGDSSQPLNYRPISLTSTICRLFERMLVEDLLYHLRQNTLITDNQYGFLPGRSTELQLLNSIKPWVQTLDNGRFVDNVNIDFAKAFDTVSHPKLLHKLLNYGVSGNVHSWIASFLSNRRQRVKVGNSYSEYETVKSGVPQGSCIGPILFLIYINDVPEICSPEVTLQLFADDTKLFSSQRYVFERNILQENLNRFAAWACTWQLHIAEEKCNVLSIGNVVELPNYTLNDKPIANVSSCRDLGICVDKTCLFKQHITNICKKAYALINMLFRCFETDDANSIVIAYKTIVRPSLEYCSCVWNPFLDARHYLGLTDKLENVQRYFTRRVFRRCHIGQSSGYLTRLEMLNLKSLELRRLHCDMSMVYKLLHNLTDVDPKDLLNQQVTGYSTRGSADFKLMKQHVRTNVALNMFTNRVVNVWNSLPGSVKGKSNVVSFKTALSCVNFSKYLKFHRNIGD